MHRFLKILLGIITLWALTLPWTFSYLTTIAPIAGTRVERLIDPVFSKVYRRNDDKIVIGVVACGEKRLEEMIVLLKSIILSSAYHGIAALEFILFADDEHLYDLDLKVKKLHESKRFNFRYEIHPVVFPAKNHDEWKKLFKPCASQRLFLHAALPHINEILYLDVDTLVVGDLREIWSRFKRMSTEQIVGAAPEHEHPNFGWYNRFAKHPYYPPLGLNTGAMLINLTRHRSTSILNWEEMLLESYKEYKDKIQFGDQDLVNIIFHQRPDAVYLLPCSFNYRPDHCTYGLHCKAAEVPFPDGKGIVVLHGNRNVFHSSNPIAKQSIMLTPMFRRVYEYFEKFDMIKDDFIRDIVHPFKKDVELLKAHENAKKITPNCDNIGNFIFNFYSMQK